MKYTNINSHKKLISFLLAVLLAVSFAACGGEEEYSEDSFVYSLDETSQSEEFTVDDARVLIEQDRFITDIFVNNSLTVKESAEYIPVVSSTPYSDYGLLCNFIATTYIESSESIQTFLEYPNKELPSVKGINGRTYVFTHKGSSYTDHIVPSTVTVAPTSDIDEYRITARTKSGITVEMKALRVNGRWLLEKGIYLLNPMAESRFTLKFGGSDRGSFASYSGNILVIELFITDKTSGFTEEQEDEFHSKVSASFDSLGKSLSQYGASVNLDYERGYYEHSETIGVRALDFDIVFAETGFGTLKKFAESNYDLSQYDNYVFAVCMNKEIETSYELYLATAETEVYYGERVIIGSNATEDEISLSMLSILGATDYSGEEYGEYITSLYAQYFPDDVMVRKTLEGSEISAVTAYACGVADDLPSLYRVFYYE